MLGPPASALAKKPLTLIALPPHTGPRRLQHRPTRGVKVSWSAYLCVLGALEHSQ
jgi:hypothetical protein